MARRDEEIPNKADMERELNSASDKRPNKLCKVRMHRVTTTPTCQSGLGACACIVGRARHMRNIKGGKRKKLTCEAIFVYRRPPPPQGFSGAGKPEWLAVSRRTNARSTLVSPRSGTSPTGPAGLCDYTLCDQ